MDGDSIARLAYLSLLGVAVVAWFISQNRQTLNKTLQQAMAWVFIFIGVIAVVGLWEDIRSTVSPVPQLTVTGETIEVPRSADGHYYLPVEVDGQTITFLVDTGASQIVLSSRDAERIGVDQNQLNYFGRALTANGEVRTAPVRLETVTLGPVTDQNISAWVNEGELHQSLLGMDYLHLFSNIQFADGRMILSR
ncbi:TIGR02281 family clan AA aspartic protease [Ruegeria lacuscaerulensis]|uniref:retropepsin-like aspartic protease family protein n=1 Tax=Ruegeria lacuscaerulensis TaxID=55218 RepID=UPI00147EC37B|nr:TIGR02281 family clan AA aspartic protease [Ruegeria lacuscaerulensis]